MAMYSGYKRHHRYITREDYKTVKTLRKEGMSIKKIATNIGISPTTVALLVHAKSFEGYKHDSRVYHQTYRLNINVKDNNKKQAKKQTNIQWKRLGSLMQAVELEPNPTLSALSDRQLLLRVVSDVEYIKKNLPKKMFCR